MSEPTDVSPKPARRAGSAVVILAILAIVGAVIWFASLATGGSNSAAPAPVVSSETPAPTRTAPSTSLSPSASPTERPLRSADEILTANLGRGYELRDESGNPADLCSANRFVAPYNIEAGKPSGLTSQVDSREGVILLIPATNDAGGYTGVINVDCR